jgi:hypothetical protein
MDGGCMLSLLRVPAAASQRIHQVVGLLLRIDGFVVELAVGLFPAVVLKRVDQMGASRMDQTNNAPCEPARCLFRFSRPISKVLSGCTLTTERRHVGCFASDCFGVVGPKLAECSRDAHGKERAFARSRTDPKY